MSLGVSGQCVYLPSPFHIAADMNKANAGEKVSLTPCAPQVFVCGLNTTSCTTGAGIVTFDRSSAPLFRPGQLDALLKEKGINTTAKSSSPQHTSLNDPLYVDGQRMYPSSVLLALGLGTGFSLIILLTSVIVMYRKLRARAPERMCDSPDQPTASMMTPSRASLWSTASLGQSPTLHTLHSSNTLQEPAALPRSYLYRYAQNPKYPEGPEVHEMDMGNPRYELGSTQGSRTPSRAELNGSSPWDEWKRATNVPMHY